MRKSQTAAEYLVILGVVITIAIITVGTVSDVIGSGDSSSDRAFRLELAAGEIGITDFAFQPGYSIFEIKNNVNSLIEINSMWVETIPCGSYNPVFPIRLGVGESVSITCWNIKPELSDFSEVIFEYRDISTDSTFNTADGKSVEDFKGISLTDCYGSDADSDGFYDICTCDDLNQSRNNMSLSHEFLYNIDFFEPSCSQYREGTGWVPITRSSSSPTPTFDGNNKVVNGLFINGNTLNTGLYGDLSDGAITGANVVNLGVIGNIKGNSGSGLVSSVGNGYLNNSYFIGSVSCSNYCAALGNSINNYGIYDSFAAAVVMSEGSYVSGIGQSRTIYNSYFVGSVSGINYVGGVAGSNYGNTIELTYVDAIISSQNTRTGGFIGDEDDFFGSGDNLNILNSYWVNNSDSAIGCVTYQGTPNANYETSANCTVVSLRSEIPINDDGFLI